MIIFSVAAQASSELEGDDEKNIAKKFMENLNFFAIFLEGSYSNVCKVFFIDVNRN